MTQMVILESDEAKRKDAIILDTVFDRSFQPSDKRTLETFTAKKWKFQPQWYKWFPWVSVCITILLLL